MAMSPKGQEGARVKKAYEELKTYMDRAMAVKTAMTLFEWDNETLAPKEAGELTARVIGILSGEFFQILTDGRVEELLKECGGLEPAGTPGTTGTPGTADTPEKNGVSPQPQVPEKSAALTPAEAANVRELAQELDKIRSIPKEEYQEFARLPASSTAAWTRAKKAQDFEAFAPVLKKVIGFQKRFAGYRARKGEKVYDVMLNDFEPGFSMEQLDGFFDLLKQELVPFLKKVMTEGKKIDNGFLTGDYPEEKQEKLARFLAS